MPINTDMILENGRFEDEMTRDNLRAFLAAQEVENLQCEQLRERAASRSSAEHGASVNVSIQQSARTLIDVAQTLTSAVGMQLGLTIQLPPPSQLQRRTQSAN